MRTLLLLVAGLAPAQVIPSAFDVVSIKLNNSGSQASNGFYPAPGRFRATNMTVEQLIFAAFHLPTGALFGTDGWMQTERYDIDANTGTAATFGDELTMLQSALEDRFGLRYHREIRQLTKFSLRPARTGSKLRSAVHPEQRESVRIGETEIVGTSIPLAHFISILQAQVGYPIKNETGVDGLFDIELRYARDDAGGPSVSAALEEQLGLKLQRQKGPVQVLVIDQAMRPSKN